LGGAAGTTGTARGFDSVHERKERRGVSREDGLDDGADLGDAGRGGVVAVAGGEQQRTK